MTQPGSTPPRPPRPSGSQPLPQTSLSAVERLESIKDHQWSLLEDVKENPMGYLVSLVLHVALIVVFTQVVWEVWRGGDKGYVEYELVETEDLSDRDLDDIIDQSPVNTDIDELPSVDADKMAEDPGYYEDLQPGAPNYLGPGYLTGKGDAGGGGDHFAGKGFGGYIKGIQKTGLEVVFVFDSTGSMGGIILEVKTRIRQLMKVVTYLIPNARVGVVTYRDLKKYDIEDYEYTVKYTSLKSGDKDGLNKLQTFLSSTEAYGGSDIPEAVYDGLKAAIDRGGWTKNTKKVIIIFGDAPPRQEENGLAKIYKLAKQWHDKTTGIISCIDTTGNSRLLEEFKEIARQGGGEASFLNNERAIVKQLVVYIFGSQWEDEIDKVYDSVLKTEDETIIGN